MPLKAVDLRDKSGEELQTLLDECEKSLVNFRIQMTTGVVENVRSARETRRDIARIKTVLRERAKTVANEEGKN